MFAITLLKLVGFWGEYMHIGNTEIPLKKRFDVPYRDIVTSVPKSLPVILMRIYRLVKWLTGIKCIIVRLSMGSQSRIKTVISIL